MEHDLLERVFIMQSRITELELENEHLKKQIVSNRVLMDQMQDVLNMRKRVRNTSQEEKDRWAFYKKHKKDKDIIERISNTMKKAGYEGMIPWQIVKQETDALFSIYLKE